MRYMLDTDTCIYIINQRPQTVFERFKTHHVGDISISSVALSELRYGAEKSLDPPKNLQSLQDFITPLEILDYGERQAEEYGRVRFHLERKGQPIGAMDLMIAAHAVSLDLILVTNNTREFTKVPGLRIETWT